MRRIIRAGLVTMLLITTCSGCKINLPTPNEESFSSVFRQWSIEQAEVSDDVLDYVGEKSGIVGQALPDGSQWSIRSLLSRLFGG